MDYYSILGNEAWFSNLEFRFPLVNAASTLIGQIGPIRGTFFFDITRAKTKGFPAKMLVYMGRDPSGTPLFKVSDAIGSYGYGFEFFFLGLPVHLEFARKLEWENMSQPFKFTKGAEFRTVFWIGYDF
jgi:outer membrane protein assembly factor BamA